MCTLLCFCRVESFMYSSNYESIVNRIGRSEAFRIWVAVRKKFVTFCKDQGNNLISYSNFHHSCLSNPLSMVYGLNAMVRTPICMKCHGLLCLEEHFLYWGFGRWRFDISVLPQDPFQRLATRHVSCMLDNNCRCRSNRAKHLRSSNQCSDSRMLAYSEYRYQPGR